MWHIFDLSYLTWVNTKLHVLSIYAGSVICKRVIFNCWQVRKSLMQELITGLLNRW